MLDLTESLLVDEVPVEFRAEFREQLHPRPAREVRQSRIAHLSLITGGDVIVDGEV